MAHQLILLKDGKKLNITQLIGNLAWSSNIDALGVELSFDFAYNDSRYFENLDLVEVGDQVALMSEGKFLGHFIVVTASLSGRFGKSFTCFDLSWYLNKNKTIIQFKKVSASQAIGKLLDKFSVKHRIAAMSPLITKIYNGEVVSDIIKDVLEQVKQETKITYRMEMDKDTLVISRMSDLTINPMVRISSNTAAVPLVATISNPSRELSIEEMRNKVIVAADGETTKVYAQSSDSDSIARFGQLTEVIGVDDKNAAQARNIAANTLAELNRIGETISCEMLGHDDIRAGRILNVGEPVTGLSGRYLIKSASHTENNGIHKVSVELEAV